MSPKDYTLYIILHPASNFWEGIIFSMRRILFGTLAALLFLTLGLLPQKQAVAFAGNLSTRLSAQDLIDEVNAFRSEKGLSPYQADPILMNVAQTHADYLAGKGTLSHVDASGRRPYQRAVDAGYSVAGDLALGGLFGEAVHSTGSGTVSDVVTFWKGNSADLGVLLSEEFHDVGVGVSVNNGITYYVLDAGAADDAVTPVSSATASILPEGTNATVVLSTSLPDGQIFHTVKKNEALWSIALAYGTTIENLKRLNGLATDEIFEGQVLLVVDAYTPTPSPTTIPMTATLGIPTSTATIPVTPTITATSTPMPQPPASLERGGRILGVIVIVALVAAGAGALLGRRRSPQPLD